MKLFLGIDIGGTRLKCGLVNESGELLSSAETHSPASVDALRQALLTLVPQVLDGRTPAAAGFGCKGIIDPRTTEVAVLPGVWSFLTRLRLSSLLDGLIPTGAPVAADNDAKAVLAGEMLWGAAANRQNAILLTLGTGIGGAVLSDGRIIRGAGGAAGHLGHVLADPNGPLCICGSRGCLETLFSARALEAAAWTLVHQGCASPMADILRAHPESLSTRFVFDQAALGDPLATHILDQRIALFAATLAGLVHAFDPEIIVLSGSISCAGEALLEPLRAQVAPRIRGLIAHPVPIVLSGLSDTSGISGAAALARLALQAA